MGGCSKDRAIEHVFPIACEFLPGDNPRGDRMAPPAFGGHDRAITCADAQPDAEIDRWGVQSPQGLDETEAGFLIVGKHMAGNSATLRGSKPDRLRLGNQIADCQNQTIPTDQDPAARAFGAERPGGERVLGDHRPQAQNRAQRTVQIERAIPGFRLDLPRDFPIYGSRHFEDSSVAIVQSISRRRVRPARSLVKTPLSAAGFSSARPVAGRSLTRSEDRFM